MATARRRLDGQYGRYAAATAGAMTFGQLVSGGALAVGGAFGYPVYAALYAASSGLRVVATRMASGQRIAAVSAPPVPVDVAAVMPGPVAERG